MKNTFGNSFCVTLFGESHGSHIGAVIDGIAPGVSVDESYIHAQLQKRKPQGSISTKRVEADAFKIVSGVFNGKTTGTPICILIENNDTKSCDYEKSRYLPRAGHADYTANVKYHGYQDFRGGGHFSGRLTAALVAAGAIAQYALEQKGIYIGTHLASCAGVSDRAFGDIKADIAELSTKQYAVLDEASAAEMVKQTELAASVGDSVGGILESAVIGMPAGVGEPWFDTLEGVLSHALFSIPAIKGVEFGDGFAFASKKGSEVLDEYTVKDGKIFTNANHNGGINGGISNGMPVIFRCAVKPTPSIFIKQNTVNLENEENTTLKLSGRHDPAIIHRARVVVDSMTAIVLCDLLAQRFGTDYLKG